MDREIDRCRSEIAAIEAELLSGNPDVAGLCLALSDWSEELRILQDEKRRRAAAQRREANRLGVDQSLTE
jgi:hypothetical protein